MKLHRRLMVTESNHRSCLFTGGQIVKLCLSPAAAVDDANTRIPETKDPRKSWIKKIHMKRKTVLPLPTNWAGLGYWIHHAWCIDAPNEVAGECVFSTTTGIQEDDHAAQTDRLKDRLQRLSQGLDLLMNYWPGCMQQFCLQVLRCSAVCSTSNCYNVFIWFDCLSIRASLFDEWFT